MAFANRVKAQAHCPSSDFANAMAEWIKTQTHYSKLFTQRRCSGSVMSGCTAIAQAGRA
jgi:hypothetical protein